MNKKTLQKVLDELNKKDSVDVSYIRGIIETLIEGLPTEYEQTVKVSMPTFPINPIQKGTQSGTPLPQDDESKMIELEGRARMKNVDTTSIETAN